MKIALITGADGFIGKNLRAALMRRDDIQILAFDIDNNSEELETYLGQADIVYHLAGINRPKNVEEFEAGNVGLTEQILSVLRCIDSWPVIVFTSSIQAELENPYGISKKRAEDALIRYAKEANGRVHIYRLANVFGKWCKPNYNSVVATFCHNIARDLPITISDSEKEIELVYIDDVVQSFLRILEGHVPIPEDGLCRVEPVYRTKLGQLAEAIRVFRESRHTLLLHDMDDRFIRCLYATYISHLPADSFAYGLTQRIDSRGELAELLKSRHVGQIFVSRTRPGITRGHHYHDTKVEKFIILDGDAVIRFRHVLGGDVIQYRVSGHEFRVVDIPPGYTHSIENVGQDDLLVLFWSNEIFDPAVQDTYPMAVT